MGLPIEEQGRLVEEFYSKKYYASYSALNKFMYSPINFYNQYVLQMWEERLDSYLIEGKLIHCLLLDNKSFDKQFVLIPGNLPTGNTKLVIDKVYDVYRTSDLEAKGGRALADMETFVLDTLREMDLHQSLKTDKQRVEKIISSQTESYWQFLLTKGNKDLVDQDTYNKCLEAVQVFRAHPKVNDLLGLSVTEFDSCEVFNEVPMKMDTLFSFGLKGIIDNIKVDYSSKTIYINDVKTSGKSVTEFPDSVEFYNYWLQAAIYMRLVFGTFHNNIGPDWKVKFTFIVIDKYNQIYPFEVSEATMITWQEKLESKLKEFEWHYVNKNYSLPYAFLTDQILL